MRLADLLWLQAVDEDGEDLGQVHDVRLLLEEGAGRPTLTVEGIIVGAGALKARLGYAYGDVRGPWPLSAVLRWMGRSARYVEWDRIVSLDQTIVRVQGAHGDLSHPGGPGDDSQ